MIKPELIIKILGNNKGFKDSLKDSESASKASIKAIAATIAASFAGGIISVKAFANFEKDFSNVITLLDEGSFKTKDFQTGVNDLKEGLKDLAVESGESFENLNKGLFDLISAGVDAEKAIDALGVATKLAIAGATDTSTAVDGLTSALNAYGIDAKNAQFISEDFFTAQKFGKTTIAELSQGFGQVAPLAASFGVSLQEVLASVSATTLAGVKTSEAYTGLKAVFANIAKPTADAAKEAERLGIAFDGAALREKGLKGFLDEITQSAGFNKDSLNKLFGSMEAVNTITALTGAQAEDFGGILTELNDDVGNAITFQNALAEKTDDADFVFKQFQNSVKNAAIRIGEIITPKVLPYVSDLTGLIDDSTDKFDEVAEAIGDAITFVKLLGTEIVSLASKIPGAGKALEIIKDVATGIGIQFRFAADQIKRFNAFLTGREQERQADVDLNTYKEYNKKRIDLIKAGYSAEDAEKLARREVIQKDAKAEAEQQEADLKKFEEYQKRRLELINKGFSEENAARLAQGEVSSGMGLGNIEDLDQDQIDEKLAKLEEFNARKQELIAAGLNEENAIRLAAAEQAKEEGLDKPVEQQTEDEFEETLDTVSNRLKQLQEEKEKAQKEELDKLKKHNKDIIASEEDKLDAKKKINAAELKDTIQTLDGLFKENTAFSKALFALNKGVAVANAIVNTSEGVTKALSSYPPPKSYVFAAITLAKGLAEVATIRSSVIQGIKAQSGGIVPGGFGGGDRVPALLEPGEIIIPSKYNPLSPSFDQTFTGGRGGGSNVQVEIILKEGAAEIFSAQQRENRALGIDT